MPAGIALATLHFLLGGLILARRFWSLLVTVLLVLAVVTLFPAGVADQLAVPQPDDPLQREPPAHDRATGGVRVSGRGTPALAALVAAGIAHVVHEYDAAGAGGSRRDGRPHYGLDAAAAIGVEPARIFKTLVVSVDGRLVVGVVPVAGELDLKALAAAAGGRRAELADPARRPAGERLRGRRDQPPRAPPARCRSTWTRALRAFATIYVSGGRRGLQVELAPGDLVRLAGATMAPIARPR